MDAEVMFPLQKFNSQLFANSRRRL